MTHQVPSPQLKTVRSPFSLPFGASIGASLTRPGPGSREAITRSSQACDPGPVTSKREKPEVSMMPTPARVRRHSSPTMSWAFERFSVGVSSKPSGAK